MHQHHWKPLFQMDLDKTCGIWHLSVHAVVLTHWLCVAVCMASVCTNREGCTQDFAVSASVDSRNSLGKHCGVHRHTTYTLHPVGSMCSLVCVVVQSSWQWHRSEEYCMPSLSLSLSLLCLSLSLSYTPFPLSLYAQLLHCWVYHGKSQAAIL